VLGAVVAPANAQSDVPSELRWRSCGSGLECSTLRVPQDPANPSSPLIDLAVVRAPARDRENRIGSLVVNPGGPGGSGVDFVSSVHSGFPSEVRDRFDIVGWDPRGAGRSDPVECVDDMASYYALDFSPDSDQERDELIAGVQSFVNACAQREGDRLKYLSTDYTVQDLDRLRAALGDERLTYIGFSYGTYIGAKYAEAYPSRVRALVLDGAVDPSLSSLDQQVQQAEGFERVLDGFVRWCTRDTSCAFHRNGKTAKALDRLRSRADADGVPVSESRPARTLTPTEFDLGLASALYEGRGVYRFLGEALDAADRGDGSGIAQLADAYTQRDANGRYGGIEESFLAIGCADGPPINGVAGVREIEQAAQQVAPRLGTAIVNNSLACALWPVKGKAAAPVRAPSAPPIVVIGTRKDPATPLAWARALADQLESGVLITAPGAQHTSFGLGNGCVDTPVIEYLVDGTAPSDDIRC
jgi:pimeloyl-ACP methyl ester carboxylesterase